MRRERGQSIVEFALIFTVFFFLVGVVVQGAFLFNGWLVVTNASREGARFGAPCLQRPQIASPCTLSQVKAVASQAAVGTDPSQLTITAVCGVDNSTSPASQVVTVQATYDVPVIAPFLGGIFPSDPVPVTADSTMRLENQIPDSPPSCQS